MAERAKVSVATVSRVLNKPDLVDPETKSKVRSAMQQLDFQPNAMARGLSAVKTNTIGVLVPNIRDFFFSELYAGIDREASAQGLKVLLSEEKSSPNLGVEGFTFLKQHQVDGIIFSSELVDEDYDAVLERIGVPVVLVLTESNGRIKLPAYKTDEVRAVFDLVAYLVSRGHKRIGLIGASEDVFASNLRIEGYCQALSYYGLEYDERLLATGDFRFESGYTAMQSFLANREQCPLTAVCAISDEMAIGAMRCLYDNGLNVPDDMSVVGFDNLRMSKMVMPGLTTVAQPFEEIGAQAVKSVVQMSQRAPSEWPTGIHYMPHYLVERNSVGTIATVGSKGV